MPKFFIEVTTVGGIRIEIPCKTKEEVKSHQEIEKLCYDTIDGIVERLLKEKSKENQGIKTIILIKDQYYKGLGSKK